MPRSSVTRRILVIEDDEAIRTLVREVLIDGGFEVVEARGGNEALSRIDQVRPDLIVLDKLMADGDGSAFAQTYRAKKGPHAPIVALSAAADAADWARRIGAAAYVAKPLDIEDLVAVVRAELAKAR